MAVRFQDLNRHLLLIPILAVGLALRLWGVTWGLQDVDVSRRPQPDEWVVYWLSKWFDHTHTLNPCPQPGRQCFFDWGAVYPTLAWLAGHLTKPLLSLPIGNFQGSDMGFVGAALGGRFVSVVLSVLTLVVVYVAAERLYGRLAALTGSLALALSGLSIELSHFATPDSTTVFLVALTLLACLLSLRTTRAPLWTAGAVAGVATGTEYHMALLLIPVTVAWLLRGRSGSLLAAYGAALAGFVVTNPYTVVDHAAFLAAQWHTLQIRTVDSAAEYSGRFQNYGPSLLYVLRYPLGYGVGFALTGWLVAGAAWGFLRHRRAELLLLSWLVPYFLLVTFSHAKFMRYAAPLLPGLTILAGGLAAQAVTWRFRPLRVGLALVAAASVFLTTTYDLAYGRLFTGVDPRVEAARWLKLHAPPGSKVGFEMLPNGLVNLPYYVTEEGYQPCFTQFKTQLLNGPMVYLLTDDYSLEDHHLVSTTQVDKFRTALEHSNQYKVVLRLSSTPTFLGMTFPIDNSGHDWRYVDHRITIYQHIGPDPPGPDDCFPTMGKATSALYRSVGGGT